MKRLLIILLILAVVALLVILLINLRVASYARNTVHTIDSLPTENRTAIVLGARVWDGGRASNTLHDRVLTGTELYKAGKVNKLLLTGGNNEPEVMKKLAIELGVPESAIVTDTLGLRTYDSCFRAKKAYGIDSAIVVTQDYHLPRALYLCSGFGIDSVGVDAKRRDYDGERYFWFREYLSRIGAWIEVNFYPFSDVPTSKDPAS